METCNVLKIIGAVSLIVSIICIGKSYKPLWHYYKYVHGPRMEAYNRYLELRYEQVNKQQEERES